MPKANTELRNLMLNQKKKVGYIDPLPSAEINK